MTLKTTTLLPLLLLSLLLHGQHLSIQPGAFQTAMSLWDASGFAAFNQPATSSPNRNVGSIYQEIPFSMPELAISAIGWQGNRGGWFPSAGLIQYGSSRFSELNLGTSLGKEIGQGFHIGAGLQWLQTRQYLEQTLHTLTGIIGWRWALPGGFEWATSIHHPGFVRYQLLRPEPIPMQVKTGLRIMLQPQITGFLSYQHSGNTGILSGALCWKPLPNFEMQAGYQPATKAGGAGIRFKWRSGQWSIGTRWSQILPPGPFFQYTYLPGSKP